MLRFVAIWLALLVGVVAPLVAAVWTIRSSRSEFVPEAQEHWAPVTETLGGLETNVAVLIDWRKIATAPAPAWSGLVEEVFIQPDDTVTTGTPIARIGGITRIASSVATPIGRPLQRGDSGADVQSLNETLAALGFESGVGDTFNAATARGVKALASELGAGNVTSFDPAWLVFLADGEGIVATTSLKLGRPAPAPGDNVIMLTSVALRAKVVGANDAPSDSEEAPVDFDAVRSSIEVPAGSHLRVGGAEFRTEADGMIGDADLTVLTEKLDLGQSLLPAVMSRDLGDRVFQIPTAAVFSGPTGKTCVHTRQGNSHVTPVEVVDSYVGATFVLGDNLGTEVEVNPPNGLRRRCQ